MSEGNNMTLNSQNKHNLPDDNNNVLKLPKVVYPTDDDADMLDSEPDLNTKVDIEGNDNPTSKVHPYNTLSIAPSNKNLHDTNNISNINNANNNNTNSSNNNNNNSSNIQSETSSKDHHNKQHELLSQQHDFVSKVYDFSKAVCMKTSDRILDDLRSDPLFLLKNEEGVLSKSTIRYAKDLSKLVNLSNLKYEPVFWNTNDTLLGTRSMTDLDNNTTFQKFSGLLVPKNHHSPDVSNSKIFHYSISIRYSNNRLNVKNSFYGFLDDDLDDDDKIWIEPRDVLEDSESVSSDSINIILKSLPQILDSATFISKETGTLVRIELYPSTFNRTDLESFSLTEIQTRIATYNSQVQSFDTFNNISITPYDCFIKLKKALTGVLAHQDAKDLKSIDLKSTKLQVMLDIQLLLDKFFFKLSSKNDLSQLHPIHFESLGDYEFVTREYFKRAILESVYYIAETSENNNDFSHYFSNSFHDIFESFKEFDTSNQLENWNSWSDQYYAENMIVLSICPFYGDQLICHIYELLTSFDPENTAIYFDALIYCATSRYSDELPYYVTILKGRGLLGFGELKSVFTKLGFNNINSCYVMNQITDEQLLSAYRNQLIVATTKYEKVTFRENLDKIANFRSSSFLKEYLNTEPLFDIYDAYKLLDIDPSLDDSLLITFYDYKASENGLNFDPNVARAFYTIVLARKSIVLMSYIDNNLPQFSVSDISLHDAYKLIGCMDSADDLTITRIFQERLHNDPGTDFRMLWKSLKTIGDHRKSKLIEGYLTSGIVNSTLLSVDQSPAGLNNIGNTCYLNSLLQYYFVIEPLRNFILEFNEVFNKDDFENNEKYKIRRIGGRTVGLKETERSYQFMYQLRNLYYQLIHENDKCVTPSRDLAYLAFSPISFEVEFENIDEDLDENDEDLESNNKINEKLITTAQEDAESQNLIELSQNEFVEPKDKPVLDSVKESDTCKEKSDKSEHTLYSDDSTTDEGSPVTEERESETAKKEKNKTAAVCKISADQFDTAFEIGSQQDVTECISNVLTQIESAMKPEKFEENNEQLDMVKTLFYGKTKQRLVPVDSSTKEEIKDGNVRTKIESFLNLIVNIGDHPKDIYDALDTFFTEDLLELEDGEVKRSLTIIDLPNILQIQIQRVQFDRERLIPVKSNEPIPFGEKLYMDRYLETDDKILIKKRIEIFHWKRRVQELNDKKRNILKTNEQGMSIRDILKSTKHYLTSETFNESDILVDMNTLEVLDAEIERLDNVLLSINNELDILQNNIDKQFEGFNKVGYSIFAIFIHRGQASYGHYFIYIRDPKANVYRKYNDEIVSEVPIEEVFNFSEGNTATPYYLTFIKDELLDKISPLQRDILIKENINKLDELNESDSEELHMDVD